MAYKVGLYDLVTKIASWPSDHSLHWYTASNSNDPNDILHGCCQRARTIFNQQNLDAERMDYQRHVVVTFDAMYVQRHFRISRNTNRLAGMAEDALNEDVLVWDMVELEKDAAAKEDTVLKFPYSVTHVLVLIATTLFS